MERYAPAAWFFLTRTSLFKAICVFVTALLPAVQTPYGLHGQRGGPCCFIFWRLQYHNEETCFLQGSSVSFLICENLLEGRKKVALQFCFLLGVIFEKLAGVPGFVYRPHSPFSSFGCLNIRFQNLVNLHKVHLKMLMSIVMADNYS